MTTSLTAGHPHDHVLPDVPPLADLVRQVSLDSTSVVSLAAALRSYAPAQVTLTGEHWQAVLTGDVAADVGLLYAGPVSCAGLLRRAPQGIQRDQLRVRAGSFGLRVNWAGSSEHTDEAALGYANADECQRELTALWDPPERPLLARDLTRAVTSLHAVNFFSDSGGGIPIASRFDTAREGLRCHLCQLALHTLEPAVRPLGERLIDGWTGTAGELLDTVEHISTTS